MQKQYKDKKHRLNLYKYQKRRIVLKSIYLHSTLPLTLRVLAKLKLNFNKKLHSITKINNRCIFTGRSRGNKKILNISRIYLRYLIHSGNLPGFSKYSF